MKVRALLLSAGLGTRLKPLTDVLPKCLAPINGRPLLDYWLEQLASHGITEIVVNTHYRGELVRDYICRSSWADRVTLVHEEHLLGTGGTLLANRDFFAGQRVLLIHADNLSRFDCARFLESHARRPAGTVMTMMLFRTPDPSSCGIVELDDAGVVQAFHEKVANPPGDLANAAIYLLEPEVLDFIASLGREEVDFSTDVIPHFNRRIATYFNGDYHRDIGTVTSWNEAQNDFAMPLASPLNSLAWNAAIAPIQTQLIGVMNALSRGEIDKP